MFSQQLKPGFDIDEYMKLLCISARQSDTPWVDISLPYPDGFEWIYRSKESELKNMWDLWINPKGLAVISIRGTVGYMSSWIENFYTGMIPAVGTLKYTNGNEIKYYLAKNPKAGVHTGWAIGLCAIAPDVTQKIDSLYQIGYRDFLIMGHSQGGAIAYLLRSYIYYQQQALQTPQDIRIKTYCSAAPKPGNIYYAYDFEQINFNGWAFNVVNPVDWVPQTPFSIQNIDDFTDINPFINANEIISQQKWPVKLVIRRMYRQINNPLNKTVKRFEKYLGQKAGKYVQSYIPEYIIPEFMQSQYYARAGTQIVLEPDSLYFSKFETGKHDFVHHVLKPYYYLSELLKNKK